MPVRVFKIVTGVIDAIPFLRASPAREKLIHIRTWTIVRRGRIGFHIREKACRRRAVGFKKLTVNGIVFPDTVQTS
jgi:hypothetical protein